jgi:hypothetical protein
VHGRRLAIIIYQILWLRIWPLVTGPALKWYQYWTTHRASIIFLAAINTSITTASELGSRTIVSVVSGAVNEGFVVKTKDGVERVHRQSLINIVMTLLASLLGGPVYFITSKLNRFVFFISFGVFNSVLAQTMSSLVIDGVLLIIGRRLLFDFWYNASVKFLLFEYVRPFLLRHRSAPMKVIGFRIGQDFITTCVRVVILNILKLSGH